MAMPEADLGELELETLKTLWDESPATVRETMQHLHDRGRAVAYTTVLTVLTRLEQKGFVVSDKSGAAYVYRPCVSRETLSRSKLRGLLDALYDGAAGPLVLQLIREERFSRDELQELQAMIDRLDQKSSRATPKKKSR